MSEKLILRDHLALDRTNLANERTFLAYIRTSLTFIILGASIIKLLPIFFYIVIGAISLITGLIFFAFGTFHFYQLKKKINQNYYANQQVLTFKKQNAQKSDPKTKNKITFRPSQTLPIPHTNTKTIARN